MKIKMDVTNADLKVGNVKINSVSGSSIVIFGDAESFYPNNVSVTRGQGGVPIRKPIPGAGPGGPVGAIR